MKKAALLSILFLLFQKSWSQTPSLTMVEKRKKIDSLISVWAHHGTFNGGILIVQKGEVIYQKSAGYGHFETKQPNTDTTHFNLASVSKPFTAIALMQLVEKKKVKLTDSVIRYLPDFPYPAITISQLLSHTSGLPETDQFEKPYIAAHPNEILSNQKVYADLVQLKVPSLAKAGEKHFYNNLNYIVLANLIEKLTKMSFATYMQKFVFEKAGMKNTYIRQRVSPNTPRYFLPTFYDTTYCNVDAITNRKIYTDYHLGGTYGDNNVVSTLRDMLMFDKALNNNTLLPSELTKQLFQPIQLANGQPFFTGGTKTYTLGWNVNQKNFAGQFVAWHDGSLVGLTTIYFKNFTDDITYIMYENKNTPLFFRRFLAISNIMDGLKPADVSLQQSLVRAYGTALVQKGANYAAARFNELKSDPNWYFQEHEMNELGYQLLQKSTIEAHKELALEIFKLNTLLFPQSANAYDSYAEALMQTGRNEEAIMMYQKTLKLNPKNTDAQNNLKKLGGK